MKLGEHGTAVGPAPVCPAARAPLAARWYSEKRLIGLTRFAVAITVLNVVGHLFLGFEQSWATPFVALAAAYGVDLLGEAGDAWAEGRRPRFAGSIVDLVKFLLPAHITALAVGMLLYAGDQLWAVAAAAAAAIASKYVFRLTVGVDAHGTPVRRHWLNPSNFGIALTLVLFPHVGIAPPYQFTENTWGFIDWLLPLIIIGTGGYLNAKATGRIPLILAWVGFFALQALIRAGVHVAVTEQGPAPSWFAGLGPMTGFAFILFTFYMITDPGTTPSSVRGQVAFAAAVAAAYAALMELHVVFGLFFALAGVTAARGAWMWWAVQRGRRRVPGQAAAVASGAV